MIFVKIETYTREGEEPRNVSIAYSKIDDVATLLGNLEHGTIITIDQKLVDALQILVNVIHTVRDEGLTYGAQLL